MRSYPIDFTSVTLFPARLVRITWRDGTVKRIAEADETITVGAETFTPLPGCQISAVKNILNGEMPSMEIKLAHELGGTVDTFQLNAGFWDGATVEVYPIDRANITTLGDPVFAGVIDTVNIDPVGLSGSFDVRGIAAQAESFIQTFQPMCRTDLFSSLCQLNEADFDHTGTVDQIIDPFNFTVAGLGSPPADGWFNQGVFQTASGFKGVTANWVLSSLTITTYESKCMTRLTEGEAITLYAGCDKLGSTCRTKFSNKINFQGEDHFLGIASIVGT